MNTPTYFQYRSTHRQFIFIESSIIMSCGYKISNIENNSPKLLVHPVTGRKIIEQYNIVNEFSRKILYLPVFLNFL